MSGRITARRRALALCVVTCAVSMPVLPRNAVASDADSLDSLDVLIDQTLHEEEAAVAIWRATQRDRRRAARALAAVDAKVTAARLDAYEADAVADVARARARDAAFRIEFVRAELDRLGRELDDVAVALYMNQSVVGRRDGAASVERAAADSYLAAQADDRQASAERFQALRAEAEALRIDAAILEADALAADRRAQSRLDGLAALQADRTRREADAARSARAARRAVAAIHRDRVRYETAVAAVAQASNSIRLMLAAAQADQPGPGRRYRLAVRPVPGAVSSGFGYRVHPVLHSKRFHMGADMNADEGDPVVAAADGIVLFAGVRSGYGNTVIIDHGNRVGTLYAHLAAIDVTAGRIMTAGDRVGLAGSTGMVTGPHLHFEVRILGVPHDPNDYFPLPGAAARARI